MTSEQLGQTLNTDQKDMLKEAAGYWRKVGNEALVQALSRTEEAAKQLIGLNAGLQGLYLAIFAFSDLRTRIGGLHMSIPTGFVLLIFFIPILCWIASLLCATLVFVPQVQKNVNLSDMRVDAWQEIRRVYKQRNDKKMLWLHLSHACLIASFVIIFLLLCLFAFLPSPIDPGPTRIIIVTPTP